MRIEESRIHRVYMSVEEFELFYTHTKEIGYGYVYDQDYEDEEEVYLITLYDDMLEDCYDLLKQRMYYEDSIGNRTAYLELKDLVDNIYYELKYSL